MITAAVIVCSDTVSAKKQEDRAGKKLIELLTAQRITVNAYDVIPDDVETIRAKALEYASAKFDLILFTGGTGVSPRDITPEAIRPLLTLEIPGIMETARQYGQQRTPYAMLSRGVAGFIDHSLVMTLPGSVNGATETMQALFPFILHVFAVAEGKRHE
jgi:molybdenum cofactor synthesis domain-containing protein